MSRATLTLRHTGRWYLGMAPEHVLALRRLLNRCDVMLPGTRERLAEIRRLLNTRVNPPEL